MNRCFRFFRVAVIRSKFRSALLAFAYIGLISGCGADLSRTLNSAQTLAEPVVVALEQYRSQNNRYPDSLDVLVESRFLEKIPVLPQTKGTIEVIQLEYTVSPNGLFYHIRFGYDFQDGLFIPSLYCRFYDLDAKTWQTSKYPPTFEQLAARHYAKIYRLEQSSDALRSTIEWLMLSAREGLPSDKQITEMLGESELVNEPNQLTHLDFDKIMRFMSNDVERTSFDFAFKTQRLHAFDDSRQEMGFREFLILRAIFEETTLDGEHVSWKRIWP